MQRKIVVYIYAIKVKQSHKLVAILLLFLIGMTSIINVYSCVTLWQTGSDFGSMMINFLFILLSMPLSSIYGLPVLLLMWAPTLVLRILLSLILTFMLSLFGFLFILAVVICFRKISSILKKKHA